MCLKQREIESGRRLSCRGGVARLDTVEAVNAHVTAIADDEPMRIAKPEASMTAHHLYFTNRHHCVVPYFAAYRS